MHLIALVMILPIAALLLFVFLPFPVALVGYLFALAIAAAGFVLMWRTSRMRGSTGSEELVGATATVARWQGDRGEVYCHGEIWQAAGEVRPLQAGDRVRVVAVRGLTLEIIAPPVGTGDGTGSGTAAE